MIAVDANGADLGAAEVAAGAALAAASGARVLLYGPAAELAEALPGEAATRRVTIVDAPVSIAKAGDPVRAVRSTPDSSIVRATRAVAGGEADALVCAGATGVALAAGLFNIRRARGVHRPALALPLPVPTAAGGLLTLIDVGANAQARAEHLVQFAHMGAAFAEGVLGVARPRVALLSNGEEAERGDDAVLAAHAALADAVAAGAALEFVGNIEGNRLFAGEADVVVTDGFTGNVALKLIEGVAGTLMTAIREVAMGSARARAGGLLMRPALRAFRDSIDPEAQGGAYLLGLRSPAVVAHGRFERRGFAAAVARAREAVAHDVVGRTHGALEAAGALRRQTRGGQPAQPAHDGR